MLTSATAVIERRTVLTGDHTTHPYEAGWASEAVFFVQVEGVHPRLRIQAQISPDGINWVDRGEVVIVAPETKIVATDLASFGSWLRLAVNGAEKEHPATVLIHLALKG